MASSEVAGSLNWARRYDQISDPQFTHGRDLIELLELQQGDRVLDIGCGTGRLAALALKRIEASGQIVGIDPAAERIELARAVYAPQIEFRVGRGEDLSDFRAATFDAVYMNSTFEWIEDKSRALAEVHRVLKPRGRIGIATTVRDRRNELGRLVRQAYRRVRYGAKIAEDRSAEHGTSLEEIRRLLCAGRFDTRAFEYRTYISSFEDAGQIIEFVNATTFGAALGWCSGDEVEALRSALERIIDEELPEERRENGIRLERYVLLVVAERVE